MYDLFDPNLDLYAASIIVVVLAAAISIVLIVKVTRRSLLSQMEAALSRLTSMSDKPVVVSETTFVTQGIGEVEWKKGGLIYVMTKTHVVQTEAEAKEEAENSFDDLVNGLAEKGFDPRDVTESKDPRVGPHGDKFVYASSVEVLIRDVSRKAEVDQVGLTVGYTSQGIEEIEIISLSDAHRTAGERAIQDAIDNAATVAATLALPMESFGMLDVDLSTVALPSATGSVGKSAKVSWRRTFSETPSLVRP